MAIQDEHQVVENLLLASSDVLCVLDAKGHLWRVGTAGQRVLGYAPQELNSLPFRTILHPTDSPQVEAACQAARQQAKPVDFAGRCLTKTGQEVVLTWSAFRWPATELLLCVGRPLTPQPGTLPVETPADNALFERIADAYIEVDTDWTITYFNGQAEQVLQVNRQQCLGRNYWQAFPNTVNSRFDHYLHLAVDSGQPVQFEALSTRTGRWLETRALPSPQGALHLLC